MKIQFVNQSSCDWKGERIQTCMTLCKKTELHSWLGHLLPTLTCELFHAWNDEFWSGWNEFPPQGGEALPWRCGEESPCSSTSRERGQLKVARASLLDASLRSHSWHVPPKLQRYSVVPLQRLKVYAKAKAEMPLQVYPTTVGHYAQNAWPLNAC